ncbi:hypothetical protein HGRIS_013530 [Hohenbuehelia grisea]|uniref:Mitochondrial carrier protein n=1 Tax=Hohenbuehelia grisea TaxID=104357 RepID=A0ABR3IVW9_9AGAR
MFSTKDSIVGDEDTSAKERNNNLYAALARTATRSIALYFSRPVRLFRPSKVSGWHSLKSLASHQGATLSPSYLSTLVKDRGFMVIPKHFLPPMAVNAMLGTVLWGAYAETGALLAPYMADTPTLMAAAAGATAGGTQALLAAPAENVRLVLEGGSGGQGWSHAWKEVFRGTTEAPHASKKQNLAEVRQVRAWMKDVGEMAGRGWDGWGWGCAKDICGFAAFFTIFDVTRRVAANVKTSSQTILDYAESDDSSWQSFKRNFPRTVHGVILVTGGVLAGLAYELVSRPFDAARRAVKVEGVVHSDANYSPTSALLQKIRDDGPLSFFRDPSAAHHEHVSGTRHEYKRLYTVLRTLGRVGPWGVGFLVWEAYGPDS